jgi:colicin import membrane protein
MSRRALAGWAIATFTLAFGAHPGAAQETRPGKEKLAPTGEVKLSPEKGKETEPPPARPQEVGELSPPSSQDLDSGPVSQNEKTLTWVGFHQAPSYSRVFLRTTERVALEVTPGKGVIVLTLKKTRARLRNNLRYLDTSYFPSAVWRIVPRRLGDDLKVEIEMRVAVSYRVRRQGEMILLDFDLPRPK